MFPYNSMAQYNNFQQPTTLIRVTGVDGAKAYQMPSNSSVALFDNNEDLMYIKTTDGAGFPTIRTFKFEEITSFCKTQENNVKTEQYITREEMENYVQHIIQQSNNDSKSKFNANTATNSSSDKSSKQ